MMRQKSGAKNAGDLDAQLQSRRRQMHSVWFFPLVLAVCSSMNLFNVVRSMCAPVWQPKAPVQDFHKNFALSIEPHPKYHVVIAPEDKLCKTLFWQSEPVYRIEDVPDGVPIYSGSHADGLGFFPGVHENGGPPLSSCHPHRIMFRDANEHYPNEWVLIRHGGRYYHLGWIAGYDVQRLKEHHQILFLPAPLSDKERTRLIQQKALRAGVKLRRISIPFGSWSQKRIVNMFDTQTGYSYWLYLEGHHVAIDQHAWEKW